MLLAGLALAVLLIGAAAADEPRTGLPAGVELPVRVRVALRVLDVLDVKETAGEGRFFVEITQRWRDPRLAFDAVAVGSARVDRVAGEADAFLASIWTPGLVIDNQVGGRESRTVAVATYANGEVVLIERFESDFRFRMNMDAFPFDRQNLVLSLSLPRYAKQEAILITTETDRLLSGVEESSPVVWRPVRLRFANDEVMGWNARSYSRLAATVELARKSDRYILRIFVPLFAVLSVSLFVLWSPALREQEKDKGTMIFSSLLGLAALSFTFESSFPGAISLNTPVAQMISLGYLYLVLVLMIEVGLTAACADPTRRFHAACLELRRQIRWGLPVMMLVVCVGIAVRALPG
nr:neurotransmitter-gated ion-channel ligand-binding protein [Rhodoplanes tepidamans]